MYEFQTDQIVFYSVIWVTSFASSFARSYSSRSFRRGGRIAFCCTSGFASLCIVGIVLAVAGWAGTNVGNNPWPWVAAAAGLGALGEEQHLVARSILLGFLKGFKFVIDEAEKRDEGK